MAKHLDPVLSPPASSCTADPHAPIADQAKYGDNPGQVEANEPSSETTGNEKSKIQDQTNLLPIKQLLIVFAGLSCALFCEFFSRLHIAPQTQIND